jgi:hypothetical protein
MKEIAGVKHQIGLHLASNLDGFREDLVMIRGAALVVCQHIEVGIRGVKDGSHQSLLMISAAASEPIA